jgi:hypothetical protein
MQSVVYRKRRNRVSRGEREWRVEPEALISLGAMGSVKRYRWKDIVSVRLCAAPARGRPWRYVFALQPKHQRRIMIDNAHYAGEGAFEDRSGAYTPFVRAALAALAEANPKARALIGETPKRYFLLLISALLGLGALAFVLIAVRTPLDALPYAGPIKAGFILLMLPLFWVWVIRAMPKGVALDALPERALPPSAGSVGVEPGLPCGAQARRTPASDREA